MGCDIGGGGRDVHDPWVPHLEDLLDSFHCNLPCLRVSPLRNEPVLEGLLFFRGEKLVSGGVGEVDDNEIGKDGDGTGNAALDDEDPSPAVLLRIIGDLRESVSENIGKGRYEGRNAVKDGDSGVRVTRQLTIILAGISESLGVAYRFCTSNLRYQAEMR